MSTYDGILPPTALDRAVDAAVAEENARPITPAEEAEIDASATRWAAWDAAEQAGGGHVAVVPIDTARVILAALRGEDVSPFTPDLVAAMLQERIERAEGRPL